MLKKIIIKSLWISLIIQALIVFIFLVGAILKKDYGIDYGLYTSFLSLQFFPIFFCFFILFFWILYRLKRK
jgi:hypothetical protein